MALQSSASEADPLKFSEVKTEFGLGDNLRSYLGAASGIPSTGTLKLTDFLGTSALVQPTFTFTRGTTSASVFPLNKVYGYGLGSASGVGTFMDLKSSDYWYNNYGSYVSVTGNTTYNGYTITPLAAGQYIQALINISTNVYTYNGFLYAGFIITGNGITTSSPNPISKMYISNTYNTSQLLNFLSLASLNGSIVCYRFYNYSTSSKVGSYPNPPPIVIQSSFTVDVEWA